MLSRKSPNSEQTHADTKACLLLSVSNVAEVNVRKGLNLSNSQGVSKRPQVRKVKFNLNP